MSSSSLIRGSVYLALTVGSALACTLAACGGQATIVLTSDSGTSDSGATDGATTQCATLLGTCSVPGAPVHCASGFSEVANICNDPGSTCCARTRPSNACTTQGGTCIVEAPGSACPSGTGFASSVSCGGDGSVCCLPTKPTVCSLPQDCNADAETSALMGTCVNGKCVCNNGFQLNSHGKCEVTCASLNGLCTATSTCGTNSHGIATNDCATTKLCCVPN